MVADQSSDSRCTAASLAVASTVVRDLQAYLDAAQQVGRKGALASDEISRLFAELVQQAKRTMTDSRIAQTLSSGCLAIEMLQQPAQPLLAPQIR